MKKIREWLRVRGYRLTRGKRFETDHFHRVVYYNPNAGRTLRALYLLHECGHVLCGDKYDYFRDPVEMLHEECEAWYRGWRLGQRLGLRVSRRAYLRARTAGVRSYARWLA